MRCLISVHGTSYQSRDIEYLAEVLHPMAAVAWDRDMAADVVLDTPTPEEWTRSLMPPDDREHAALRFAVYSDGECNARTGRVDQKVAAWDRVAERWVPA